MQRPSILLVDDDNVTLQVLSWRLKAENFSVTPVSSGRLAIKALQDAQYDLVITDLVMEEMDGFDVLAAVKSTEPLTPVIMISGHSMYDEAALLLGADNYLVKPFEIEELIFKIESCLHPFKHLMSEMGFEAEEA